MLTPVVKWAQNGPQIDITIDLSDVSNPDIDLNETHLYFRGFGHGAQGEDVYNVQLDFYNLIDCKQSRYNVTDRSVSFKILKKVKGEEWPRLLKQTPKPVWLKIDFDKWKLEDSDDEKKKCADDEQNERINRLTFERGLQSQVDAAKKDLVRKGKVGWLTMYYLFQVVAYAIVAGKLICSLWSEGIHAYKNAYDDVEFVFLSGQICGFIEIIQPLIGINNIGLRAPLLEVGLRSFFIFVLVAPVKQLHDTPTVFVLIFAWALHELIRFSHDVIILHGFNHWVLVWIRYSYWIITYPVGFISAGIIIFQSIFIADEMNRLVYPLPNNWNISFSFSSLLKVFLCCYVPGCLYLQKHMWTLRQRKVGRKRRMKIN